MSMSGSGLRAAPFRKKGLCNEAHQLIEAANFAHAVRMLLLELCEELPHLFLPQRVQPTLP